MDFDSLHVGQALGVHSLVLEPCLVSRWLAIYSVELPDERMPLGMISVVSIRAYMSLLAGRPAGGIHAAQRYEIARLPDIGQTIHTAITVLAKERKAGRAWVVLQTPSTDEKGEALFTGIHTAIWAG